MRAVPKLAVLAAGATRATGAVAGLEIVGAPGVEDVHYNIFFQLSFIFTMKSAKKATQRIGTEHT